MSTLPVRARFGLLGVLTLSACVLAWFVFPRAEPIERGEPMSAPASAVSERAPVETPDAQSAIDDAVRVAVFEPAAVPALETPSQSARRWLVRGRVRGAPSDASGETRVRAHCIGAYHIPDDVEGLVASDGTFELDVTVPVEKWLPHGTPSDLVVSAEHPLCIGVETRIPFARGEPVHGVGGLEHTEFRCELVLDSAAVISGHVRTPSDGPRPGSGGDVERPRVGLFEARDGEPREVGGHVFAVCDADGRFELRSARGGSFFLVAIADGLRPEALAVELVLGRAIEVGPLVLSSGASISGHVRRLGRSVGAGVVVSVRQTNSASPHLTFPPGREGWTRLTWRAGAPEFEAVDAVTLADGSYVAGGLAEREFEVWASSLSGLRASLGGRQRVERVVHAPASGVDLEGVPAAIRLVLRVDGGVPVRADLEGANAELLPGDPSRNGVVLDLTSDGGDFGLIQVESDVEYTLRVAAGRFAGILAEIPPLAPGEERVVTLDLRRAQLASTIVLIAVADEAEPVGGLDVWLNAADDQRGERARLVRVERSGESSFRIEQLPPGKYRLVLRPRERLASGELGHHVPTEIVVDVPPNTTVERHVRFESGGRIRMCAKDAHGGFVRATVELRDAGGAKLETDFYCEVQNTHYGCGWYLCEQGLNDHPPLPPGHYEFTLSADGYESEVCAVDLVAGETRTLEVFLRRR